MVHGPDWLPLMSEISTGHTFPMQEDGVAPASKQQGLALHHLIQFRSGQMESYKRYQQAKQELAAAHSWLSNKTKIDSQSNSRYQLSGLKVHGTYCGQSYAGANNYHESPAAFDEALASVIRENFDSLCHAAIGLMDKKLREALLECENDVAALSDEIATAKLSS